jgi:anti-sigma-K factor RskA
MDYGRPSLADALAAQYVAGTLRGSARRRFEALLPAHPALGAAVRHWQGRLMPLTVALPPQTPPPSVWQGVERRLWPRRADAPRAWWQRLSLWRGLTGLATVAALALAVMVVNPAPAQAPVVVVLQGTGALGPAVNTFVASLSGDGRALVTRPVQPVALQPDRALELWALPPDGPPRSLGLVSANGTTIVPRAKLPGSLLTGNTASLAVTLEPPGGAPHPPQHGPVVYVGKLQL